MGSVASTTIAAVSGAGSCIACHRSDGEGSLPGVPKAETLTAVNTASGAMRPVSPAPAPTISSSGMVYVSSRKEPAAWVFDQQLLNRVATIAPPAGEGHQLAVVK